VTETRTERGSCKFTVQEVEGGKHAIVVQTFHDTIGPLRAATLGFSLLSGTGLPRCTILAALGRTFTVTTKTVIAVFILLCCLTLTLNLHAQGGDVERQIKQLQQESRDAQMKNDASWAQQHLADGFVAGNSWGDWESREDFIKDLQDKTNKWKSGNVSDVKVATFGANTAVSHYKFTYDAELRGKHRARTVICSDTWVNDSGTWKTASTHCSMVEGSGK
jgi:hypothetical protein